MSTQSQDDQPQLQRRLGVFDAVVIGLGSMIGAGIFVALGPAAAAAGSGLLVGLAVAAAVAFCNATSSARLAARYLDAVTAALHGTQAGYFVYPIAPGLIEATAVFAQAAHEAGLGAIVNMSQISARRDAKSHAAQQHWIAERLLDRGTVPVTHLRPTFFAENLLLTAGDVIEHAAIRMPLGHGRHAPITVEDQAHVIAAILADPRPHAGATYPLHGPVEMDLFEIARVFSTVLDRPVGYEPTDYDTFADMLTAVGFSAHLIQPLRHVSQDFQRGVFAGTNDVVARIGHKQPVTVAAFVDQHRGIFTPVPIPSGHPS